MLPPLSRLVLVDGAYGEHLAASEAPRITTTLLVRVVAVIVLIAALVVFVSRRILLPHQKRALTLTEINTRLNRNENGGTGVVFRKWRHRLFPPPVFGDEDELAEAEREAELEQAEAAAAARNKDSQPNGDAAARDKWSYTSKPSPEGLRSCLRTRHAGGDATASAPHSADSTRPDTPDTTGSPRAAATTPPPAKRVRIVEPELEELELLRELWSSPEMRAMTGSSGIGGFRRTRDFYSRSQGGSAVVKRPGASAGGAAAATVAESGSLIPATKSDDDEGVPVVAGPPSSKVKPVQRLRDSVQSTASHAARPNSLSPAPIHRRHRTLSPTSASAGAGGRSGSPAFIVGSQSSAAKASPNRRRALSPGVASTGGARTASPGGGAAADVVGPRWIKTRHLAAGPRNTQDSVAGAADSSEHETTDDDASADEVSDRLVPDAAATTNGTSTPPPSSLSYVLHTLTGMDALATALDAPSSNSETGSVIVKYSGDERADASVPSPAASLLSGGESPQDSPTPGLHHHHHHHPPTKSAVAVRVTPYSPPVRAATPLPPLSDEAPESPTSPSPLKNSFPAATAGETSTLASKNDGAVSQSDATRNASSSNSAASSSALSPSPCVAAQDRRLSLRVQQTLRDKRQKRHGSPVSIGSHGSSETVTSSPPVPLSA